MNIDGAELFTRRLYLITQAMMAGADIFTAQEAVASTAIEHPEWDMDELRTWAEWDQLNGKAARARPRSR